MNWAFIMVAWTYTVTGTVRLEYSRQLYATEEACLAESKRQFDNVRYDGWTGTYRTAGCRQIGDRP